VEIKIMGLLVCKDGLDVPFDEDEALRLFDANQEIVIDCDLGAGSAETRVWTCDLTHDYISINADYRS
jgi:glutamate N-acetyltransferase/amino-acid N-acetyltransferase